MSFHPQPYASALYSSALIASAELGHKPHTGLGGPRVRIQDIGSSGGSCSRGWHIVRNQWREFLIKRGDIPNRVETGLAPPPRPQTGTNLSKEAFDRMLDQILAHFTSDSPRTVAKANIWTSAAQTNSEVRALLPPPREPMQAEGVAPPKDPSYAFFPPEWSNALSDETVAELIVDAYTSAFADALLDGAISLVDVSNKFSASQAASSGGLQESMSEPTLRHPGVNRRLKKDDKVLLRMGLDDKVAAASEGFTMAGLSKDSWDAWNAQNYHKCKPLDPLVRRIQKATEAQRPQRRTFQSQRSKPIDHRKYLWPMAATNFPDTWNKVTSPSKSQSQVNLQDWDGDDEPPGEWLLRVREGKTTFPYSLVSHRAFLESQPNAALKDKAKKLAPLNLTSSW